MAIRRCIHQVLLILDIDHKNLCFLETREKNRFWKKRTPQCTEEKKCVLIEVRKRHTILNKLDVQRDRLHGLRTPSRRDTGVCHFDPTVNLLTCPCGLKRVG